MQNVRDSSGQSKTIEPNGVPRTQQLSFSRYGAYNLPVQSSNKMNEAMFNAQMGTIKQQVPSEDEAVEHEIEYIRTMKNIRKQIMPQLEQIIAYYFVPALGAMLLKKFGLPIPTRKRYFQISICADIKKHNNKICWRDNEELLCFVDLLSTFCIPSY
ncbi:hypothetical protein RFI_22433 [Reticulomyxa filosa]|uniref:Uncharacterized protein n=1 Tax=Reticulomyxa filosa TaxID=46433 RepID=X6MM78_RETFI|nr:hypothetical protein RFI_22433 [Reticulomyxa filosa]|eukprot:ETO14934.1 hypothetical protein RFI_22433 [Reticulomyxa filosa]